jgi:hypothetical protein
VLGVDEGLKHRDPQPLPPDVHLDLLRCETRASIEVSLRTLNLATCVGLYGPAALAAAAVAAGTDA